MRRFESEFSHLSAPRIIDVGGTTAIWRYARPEHRVTLLNRRPGPPSSGDDEGFEFVCGDALALPFPPRTFDIAFSNSVIEHVGGFDEQQVFAAAISGVASHLWVQTPARSFPIEPHFMSFGIHYLPRSLRPPLLRFLSVWGWIERPSLERCRSMSSEIRLLTKNEMSRLFPDCRILTERFCGLPKSYIATR